MSASIVLQTNEGSYELRFRDVLSLEGALAFPCDAEGHVNIDGLSERERNSYFYARAVSVHASGRQILPG
jgi:hypothetical protein